MSELTIEVLKEIVEKLPNDFIVEFKDRNGSTVTVSEILTLRYLKKISIENLLKYLLILL